MSKLSTGYFSATAFNGVSSSPFDPIKYGILNSFNYSSDLYINSTFSSSLYYSTICLEYFYVLLEIYSSS